MTGELLRPDLCIVGGGAAGHPLAFAAAGLGLRCVLVDPREPLGTGQAADLAEGLLTDAARRHPPGLPFDWPAFIHWLGLRLADAAPEHRAERLRAAGVTVVRAAGAFRDARTVVAGDRVIQAKRVVLATGAVPRRPAWTLALDPDRLLSPARITRAPAPPGRIAVVLDEPHGLAIVQALQRLGSAVTAIAAPDFGEPFDPELMTFVLAALERTGVTLHADRTVASADRDGTLLLAARADAAAERIAADAVVLALRPEPAIAGLALDRAGIAVRDGAPVVGPGLRTTNRRVFAIGDVLGRPPPGGATLPAAIGLVLRAAVFRQPVRWRPERIPLAIRTDPAVAQVGRLTGGSLVFRSPVTAGDGPAGLAKVVGGRDGRVIGAGVVGDEAAAAIGPWTLAVTRKVPLSTLAGLAGPAGEAGDALRRAALGALTARLRRPAVRRLIAWLRRLP